MLVLVPTYPETEHKRQNVVARLLFALVLLPGKRFALLIVAGILRQDMSTGVTSSLTHSALFACFINEAERNNNLKYSSVDSMGM